MTHTPDPKEIAFISLVEKSLNQITPVVSQQCETFTLRIVSRALYEELARVISLNVRADVADDWVKQVCENLPDLVERYRVIYAEHEAKTETPN
jgi:hypothetical protein